ncbi:uncharacterized protein LOC135804458 [Sycon ciliatum]|uniref:uncharacterized protein LOC135804458 n=1 Tax=Sycon ciliatum TaxID=27933 RepID=UPI0031F65455
MSSNEPVQIEPAVPGNSDEGDSSTQGVPTQAASDAEGTGTAVPVEGDSDAPLESGSLSTRTSDNAVSDVSTLRAWKTQAKGDFTKVRRRVLVTMTDGECSTEEVVAGFTELEEAYERATAVMADLMGCYAVQGDIAGKTKVLSEIETMESQLSAAGDALASFLSQSTNTGYSFASHSQQQHFDSEPVSEFSRTTASTASRLGAPARTRSRSGISYSSPHSQARDYLSSIDTVVDHERPTIDQAYDHRDRSSEGVRMNLMSHVDREAEDQSAESASATVRRTSASVTATSASSTVNSVSSASPPSSSNLTASQDGTTTSTTRPVQQLGASSQTGTRAQAPGTPPNRPAPPAAPQPARSTSGSASSSATASQSAAVTASASGTVSVRTASRGNAYPNPAAPVFQSQNSQSVAGLNAGRRPPVPSQANPVSYSGHGGYGYQPVGLQPQDCQVLQGQPPAVGASANAAGPWMQLQKISIPVFDGDKRRFEGWHAAFMACIDAAPMTPETKMLQLRQYLAGEPLRAVESLGYSAGGYNAAKQLLERKYGGERRRIAIHTEELENIKPVRVNKPKDLERFVDLLTVAVSNLRDAGRAMELQPGTFYGKLLKKLDRQMLAQYHRWRHDKRMAESVEVFLEWCSLEAEFLTTAMETVDGLIESQPSSSNTGRQSQSVRPVTLVTAKEEKPAPGCAHCKGSHPVWKCLTFKASAPTQRWQVAQSSGLCFRCLGRGHSGRECQMSRTCGIDGCQKSHHRLLHDPRRESASDNGAGRPKPQAAKPTAEPKPATTKSSGPVTHNVPCNCSAASETAPSTEGEHVGLTTAMLQREPVSLRTIPVVLIAGNRRMTVNAILDDGSTRSYVNSDVAAELGVQGQQPERMSVHTLNGHKEVFLTTPVALELQSLDGRLRTDVELYTTKKVVGDFSVIDWQQQGRKWEHLQGVQFPPLSLCRSSTIDVLLGLDHADLHVSLRDIPGKPGEPVARLTPLGWTCVAPSAVARHTGVGITLHGVQMHEPLDRLLRKFWELEDVPAETETVISADDQQVVSMTKATMSRIDQRYEVGVPWRKKPPDLAENYDMALRRLESTERRLAKQPEVSTAYRTTIKQYEAKGYVRRVPVGENSVPRWLLAHFPVVRMGKSTTKVRIVFDASAKQQGTSLNDVIHQGPKLQQDLSQVLLRFRKYPVALACDISEMYLQIQLREEDRPFHRFLWREDPSEKPEVYEFQRVVFGVNCSPFLAQLVTQEHARTSTSKYPNAAETVLESTYMDDSLDSAPSVSAGIDNYHQLTSLWGEAGMHARKWLSNSQEIMDKIPEVDRAANVAFGEALPTIRTLGVQYDASTDNFGFTFSPPPTEVKLTKRAVLKKAATIFDPLGFMAPVTVCAKMLLQRMWSAGLQWDDPLEPTLEAETRQWFNELPELAKIRIPRCLHFDLTTGIAATESKLQCHVFADASEQAYGAVAYARVKSSGGVQTRLVAAKTRVAPLHSVSIPRLELMAAVMAIRLASVVTRALGLAMSDVVLWTDSQNVLYWIRGRSRSYKAFVANRVSEIHNQSQPSQWHHVPTDQNPADVVSRGTTVPNLDTTVWLNGPAFLQQEPEKWPMGTAPAYPQSEARKEEKKVSAVSSGTTVSLLQVIANVDDSSPLHANRFINWARGVRLWARVLRFGENCRRQKEDRQGGELMPDELAAAETEIIKLAQGEAFHAEMPALRNKQSIPERSPLRSLCPYIDEEGVIRCRGRLEFADFLPRDAVNPIILPRHHTVTRLIVQQHHDQAQHVGGVNQVYASLCSRFWIVAGREAVRDVERKCPRCKLLKARPAQQVMAPLPRSRITPSFRAFARAGVDFAGPFETVHGRGRKRTKRYLCLFTCLATRAVHLEIAYSMDTNSFLNAFYRFVGRRGLPERVISDNGTNFVGAQGELKELVAQMDEEQIIRTVADQRVTWQFNPAAAPHFGGVFEVMIRAAKRAVSAILKSADITDEELTTAFVAAESLINSRPLTYTSSSPSDEPPLTPNHFLFGQCGGTFAPSSVDTTDFNPRKRWRRVQQLVHHFWQRWIREWLPLLTQRKKWRKPHNDVKIGDVMLLLSPNTPRGNWPLARVLETFPGRDGHVRVVKVQVGKSTLIRPISKLCPIESPAE